MWSEAEAESETCAGQEDSERGEKESKDHHQGHPGESGPCWWQHLKADSPKDTAHCWFPRTWTKEDATSPDKAHKSPAWPLQMLIWTKKKTSGLLFYGQMKQKLNCLATMMYPSFGVKKEKPSTLRTPSPLSNMVVVNLMLWGWFSANGPGNLITVNGTMKKEEYIKILNNNISAQQRPKTRSKSGEEMWKTCKKLVSNYRKHLIAVIANKGFSIDY
ncbi:hypothetical protein L3Q82_020696 [Scortum barcoo]|uniref:Uncharacterized protein n=1 Tax=Scortum barcoo TaxID=214431 RepID=A0ACB8V888_9TELE|nr:hypothetical protein L3Q82_020696 [Scortum barcoo]